LIATATVAIVMTCASLRAHEVVLEQIVRMTVAATDNRLDARISIPASLLSDAGLGRTDDGRIDPSVGPAAMQAVAADVARNLDVRKDGFALSVATAAAQLEDEGRSVGVSVTYAFAGPAAGFSARLNAFQGTALRPPRTDATYLASPDRPQHLTVTGKPTRISLDPGAAEAFTQGAGSAFDQVLNGAGDHLLFLICLLLPLWSTRESVRLVGVLLAAQAAGIVASSVVTVVGIPLLVLQMVAASVVLVAALATIVGPTARALAGLAVLFGLMNGTDFGAAFDVVRPFAGSHGLLASTTFTLATLCVESWLAAVILATRRWIDHVTVSGSILTVVAAAIVAHVAIHRVLDRGQVLEQTGSFASVRALTLLTLAWTTVMMAVAFVKIARGRNARKTDGVFGAVP